MTTAAGNQTSIEVPARAYNSTVIYLVLIFVFSSVLNSLAAYTLAFKDRCSSAQAVLIFSLTSSNALFNVATIPLSIHANYKREWKFGQAGCNYYAFMTFTGGLSSIFHLLLLSIERYIAVVHPFQANTLLRHSHIYLSILVSWLVTFAITISPIFGWSSYQEDARGTSCSIDIFPTSTYGISYNVFISVAGYIIPISVIVYLNILFLKEVKRVINRGREKGNSVGGRDYVVRKSEGVLMKQMCLQVVAFVASFNVSWFPYAIIVFLGLIRRKSFENTQISSIPSYFAKSYTLYDPLIFFVLNKRYRSMLLKSIFKTETHRARNIELRMIKK